MSYQKTIIVGNLGGDPEMRYLDDGTPVTRFSVAVNEKRGESESTTWYRVSAWRRQAETCAQYLAKGRAVLVEGKLAGDRDTGGPRIWTGNDGTPRASFELNADRVVFLSSGQAEAEPDAQHYVDESEIPF